MSEHNNQSLPAEETTEIEFSALELKHLAKESEQAALPLLKAALASHAAAAIPAQPRSRSILLRSPLALGTVGSVLFLALIGAGYTYTTGTPPAPPRPLEQPLVAEASAEIVAAPAVAEEPVLVKNPFDKGEVFEFPPGTTDQQAHDAVAEMLLQRAIQRQAEYDAKRGKKRRAS